MLSYIIRRIISVVPSILIASILIFSFMHLIPGDPAAVMLGDIATEEQIEQLRQSMGLDKPLYMQYWNWMKGVSSGNFGNSVFFEEPVLKIILSRIETSFLISFFSMLLIIVFGLPIGIISAVKYNSWLDQLSLGAAMFGASIPTFWLGLNLMLLFSVLLGWFPTSGFPSIIETGDISNLRYLVLPCITLAAPNAALIIRLTRSSMLDVLRQDYVMSARAKGLSEFNVNIKHAFRNALISVVAALGFTFVGLLSGTVVTETVFSLPGIGRLIVQSVLRRDYPVIQGVVLVIVFIYIFINLLVDFSYAYLDPRIKYS